jgi:hypothetical protein
MDANNLFAQTPAHVRVFAAEILASAALDCQAAPGAGDATDREVVGAMSQGPNTSLAPASEIPALPKFKDLLGMMQTAYDDKGSMIPVLEFLRSYLRTTESVLSLQDQVNKHIKEKGFTGLCSAHQNGETPDCNICYPAKAAEQQSEANVLAVRGSYDAPGFDACIEAEKNRLMAQQPVGLVDPDMPEQQLRLHFGELTAQGVRDVRAAIRFANNRRMPERESGDYQPLTIKVHCSLPFRELERPLELREGMVVMIRRQDNPPDMKVHTTEIEGEQP